jgi:hypothetical protein
VVQSQLTTATNCLPPAYPSSSQSPSPACHMTFWSLSRQAIDPSSQSTPTTPLLTAISEKSWSPVEPPPPGSVLVHSALPAPRSIAMTFSQLAPYWMAVTPLEVSRAAVQSPLEGAGMVHCSAPVVMSYATTLSISFFTTYLSVNHMPSTVLMLSLWATGSAATSHLKAIARFDGGFAVLVAPPVPPESACGLGLWSSPPLVASHTPPPTTSTAATAAATIATSLPEPRLAGAPW